VGLDSSLAEEVNGRYELLVKRGPRMPLGSWDLVDSTTSATICTASGLACLLGMTTRIDIQNGRSLRFALRGMEASNAVVTDVNQDGQPVMRFRSFRPRKRKGTLRHSTEVLGVTAQRSW
jgi:hypothetical protein